MKLVKSARSQQHHSLSDGENGGTDVAWTEQDLRSMVKGVADQVAASGNTFNHGKLGGTINWYQNARPDHPVTKYFESMGGKAAKKEIAEDLKSRFHDLLAQKGVLPGSSGSQNKSGLPAKVMNAGFLGNMTSQQKKWALGGGAALAIAGIAYYYTS